MRLFKLRFLSLFKLPFSISRENRSLLNAHLRATFGVLNGQLRPQNEKRELKSIQNQS